MVFLVFADVCIFSFQKMAARREAAFKRAEEMRKSNKKAADTTHFTIAALKDQLEEHRKMASLIQAQIEEQERLGGHSIVSSLNWFYLNISITLFVQDIVVDDAEVKTDAAESKTAESKAATGNAQEEVEEEIEYVYEDEEEEEEDDAEGNEPAMPAQKKVSL